MVIWGALTVSLMPLCTFILPPGYHSRSKIERPGTGSVIKSKRTMEHLSYQLLTALSAGESITLDDRGGDGRDAVMCLFKQELS